MTIDRHVFGSFKGYTTLAKSAGVSSDDCRQLEGAAYAFGQSDDKKYLKSLRSNPAYFTRVLRGGRRGLTRVLEGQPDDNGRPTLCMITAIISQRDWDTGVCGDVSVLLERGDIWQFQPGAQLPQLSHEAALPDSSVARRDVPKMLALMAELERAFAERRAVIVSEEDFSSSDLRLVEMLIPPSVRPSITTSFRSLSAQLPTTLNCLADQAGAQRVSFRFVPGSSPGGPYSDFLVANGIGEGNVPLPEILAHTAFGRGQSNNPSGAARTPAAPIAPAVTVIHRRSVLPMAAMLLLAVIAGPLGFYLGKRTEKTASTLATLPSQAATQPTSTTQPEFQPVTQVQTTTAPTTREFSEDAHGIRNIDGEPRASLERLAAEKEDLQQKLDAAEKSENHAKASLEEVKRDAAGLKLQLNKKEKELSSLIADNAAQQGRSQTQNRLSEDEAVSRQLSELARFALEQKETPSSDAIIAMMRGAKVIGRAEWLAEGSQRPEEKFLDEIKNARYNLADKSRNLNSKFNRWREKMDEYVKRLNELDEKTKSPQNGGGTEKTPATNP